MNKVVGELVRASANVQGLARGCKDVRRSVRPCDSAMVCECMGEHERVYKNTRECAMSCNIM